MEGQVRFIDRERLKTIKDSCKELLKVKEIKPMLSRDCREVLEDFTKIKVEDSNVSVDKLHILLRGADEAVSIVNDGRLKGKSKVLDIKDAFIRIIYSALQRRAW